MSSRPIKTHPDTNRNILGELKISGHLCGRYTYVWFGNVKDRCIGTLSGQKLHRLAKAIVKQFELDK